ncbi:MAG: T9SS type A sorting domain-containing protein, partial [Flavobacteriales bacterium]
AQEQLTLKIPTTTPIMVEVFNNNGALQQARTTIQNGVLQVDVSDWNAGLYLLRLMDDNGEQVVRSFVVE